MLALPTTVIPRGFAPLRAPYRFTVHFFMARRERFRHRKIIRQLDKSEMMTRSADLARNRSMRVSERACGLRNPSQVAAP